jgi:hypothetical protein
MNAAPLAYAFWHWKRAEIRSEDYETRQRAFQLALAADPSSGFLGGTTVRLRGAPWAAGGETAYEDWYLVSDMTALGQLNDAAVSGSRQAPHDAVARYAAGGTAGLYGLFGGEPLNLPGFASWFSKPAGMTYSALRAVLAPVLTGSDTALWSRRMTLGPTPEFCLHSRRRVVLPVEFVGQSWALEPIWPEPS